MSKSSALMEPVWLSWYRAKAVEAGKKAKFHRLMLVSIMIFLIVPPALLAVRLAFEQADALKTAWGILPVALHALIFAAFQTVLIYAMEFDQFAVSSLRLRVMLYLVFILVFDRLLFSFFSFPFLLGLGRADPAQSALVMTVAAGGLSFAFLFIFLYSQYRSAAQSFNSSQVISIDKSSRSSVWHIVSCILDRAQEIGLPNLHLSLWFWRSDLFLTPSLFAVRNKASMEYRLVIPRPFFEEILGPYPNRAAAMVAHELAHAFQNDVEQWSRNDLFYMLLSRAVAPLTIASGITTALLVIYVIWTLPESIEYLWIRGTIQSILGIAIGAILILHSSSVRKARLNSESLADFFAFQMTTAQDVIESIQFHTNDTSPFHPSRIERLRRLGTKIEEAPLLTEAASA